MIPTTYFLNRSVLPKAYPSDTGYIRGDASLNSTRNYSDLGGFKTVIKNSGGLDIRQGINEIN